MFEVQFQVQVHINFPAGIYMLEVNKNNNFEHVFDGWELF